MADASLDATGLKCPLPVLKARKVMRRLPAGGTLEVLATDPGAVADFQSFCAAGGHELVEQTSAGAVLRFLIRKGG